MDSKNLVFLVFLMMFLSACSNSNIGGIFSGKNVQGGSDVPTSGSGLIFDIEIDSSRLPDVNYDIIFKNRGDKPITIKEEDFSFYSVERYGGQDVFSQESLDEMRNSLFKNGDIVVPIEGEFRVNNKNLRVEDKIYFDDGVSSLRESVSFVSLVSYDYVTEFNNNLEVDLTNYEVKAFGVSQAAPIKLVDINLVNSNGDKLEFVIEDRGPGDSSVEILDTKFFMGSSQLSCNFYHKTKGSPKKVEDTIFLSDEFSTLLAVCDIDLSQFDENSITNTKTYGSFSYKYVLEEIVEISFPEVRSYGYE